MWGTWGTEVAQKHLALAALLLWAATASADKASGAGEPRDIQDDYFHRSWNRENGLPDDTVNAILQSRDGYLWVGTSSGLARFDGMRFVVFNRSNTPEMEDDHCWTLAEDNSGTLWITTDTGFLRAWRADSSAPSPRTGTVSSGSEPWAG